MREVKVFKKPKVAVISTGNEIISLDEDLEYGKLYDINSKTISSAIKSCGCTPISSEVVKDDYQSLNDQISGFKDADVIITSGGTSAGLGDVFRLVIDDLGEVLVHGVAVKPGKPTLIGLIQNEAAGKYIWSSRISGCGFNGFSCFFRSIFKENSFFRRK